MQFVLLLFMRSGRVNASAAAPPLKGCPEAERSAAGMVDAARSEEDAPLRDLTEDAEETGAAGKFDNFHFSFVMAAEISTQPPRSPRFRPGSSGETLHGAPATRCGSRLPGDGVCLL